jgi:hypothetical protein
VAEITAAQVHDLLTGTHEFITAGQAAAKARDSLGHLFLDVARQARVGLRELSAATGLHHSTIRAMIQRATGPGLPDGWEQLELPLLAEIGQPIPGSKPVNRSQPMPPPSAAPRPAPVMTL